MSFKNIVKIVIIQIFLTGSVCMTMYMHSETGWKMEMTNALTNI